MAQVKEYSAAEVKAFDRTANLSHSEISAIQKHDKGSIAWARAGGSAVRDLPEGTILTGKIEDFQLSRPRAAVPATDTTKAVAAVESRVYAILLDDVSGTPFRFACDQTTFKKLANVNVSVSIIKKVIPGGTIADQPDETHFMALHSINMSEVSTDGVKPQVEEQQKG